MTNQPDYLLNPNIFDKDGNITSEGIAYVRGYLEARLPELERKLDSLRDARRITKEILELEFTI